MRKILVIGAGKSASYLIKYLLDKSESENLIVIVGDINFSHAKKLTHNHDNAQAIQLDINDKSSRQNAIKNCDIVVSMLPARFHIEAARDCVTFGKHMVTASYVSEAMHNLNSAATQKGLVFMNEIGVDPGIDHMSAMQVIDRIRDKGQNFFKKEPINTFPITDYLEEQNFLTLKVMGDLKPMPTVIH